jgi:effector-binding domain-containing protein
MKFIKYTLIGIGILILTYVILCFVGPKKFVVNKSITINANTSAIWPELADFKKWEAWSPWHKYDTAMVNTYTGEPNAVGHKNSWTSKVMGDGSQEIVAIEQEKGLKTALKFADWGPDAVSYAEYKLEADGENSKATWTMDGSEIPFVFRGLMVIGGMQKAIEKDYEDGLNALKTLVEAKPKVEFKELVLEEITISDIYYVGKRWNKINEKELTADLFGKTYGEIGALIGGADKSAGPPFSIGHHYDPNTGDMDLEIAMQVAEPSKGAPGFTTGKIPAGKALKYVYYGPYEKTGEAWMSLNIQAAQSHKIRWSGYEVYVDDPTGKDMKDVATWLILPIE